MTAVATGETVEALALAAALAPMFEEILTAQPSKAIAVKLAAVMETNPRTAFRLARTGVLG